MHAESIIHIIFTNRQIPAISIQLLLIVLILYKVLGFHEINVTDHQYNVSVVYFVPEN